LRSGRRRVDRAAECAERNCECNSDRADGGELMRPVEGGRRVLPDTPGRPFHQRSPERQAAGDVVVDAVGRAPENARKKCQGDEDQRVNERRTEVRCAGSVGATEAFGRGPDEKTESYAEEIGEAAY